MAASPSSAPFCLSPRRRWSACIRQGLRREVTEIEDQAAGVADRDPTHLNDAAHSVAEPQPMDKAVAPESVERPAAVHTAVEPLSMDETVAADSVQYPVLALSAVEPQPMDETVESERAMTATASRRARRLAFVTLLLAATAVSGYYYYDRSAQLAQAKSAGQPTPLISPPTTGAAEVEKAPPPAAPVVAIPRADPEPVPADRPLDAAAAVTRPASTSRAAGAVQSRGDRR